MTTEREWMENEGAPEVRADEAHTDEEATATVLGHAALLRLRAMDLQGGGL